MVNKKQTSPGVAKKAGKILRNPNSTPDEKAVAGSDLAQTGSKPKTVKKKK